MYRPFFAMAAVALLALGLGVSPSFADDVKDKAPPVNIDIAICLDTSGSMNGLINSAKAKLWDIVNDLAKIKPAPNLRVALYSYGNDGYDPKAGWIRKELDLTTDLDELYKKLFGLTIHGGTEYATRVSRDAVEQLKWSEDPKALKIIFVCGNEPAGQDPVVKLKDAADKAKEKGIIINTIFCGPADRQDGKDWKEFAALAGGRFSSIDQDQGVVAVATPMDKELAELSAKLNATYVVYGGKEAKEKQQNQAAQDSNAAQSGGGVAAARAVAKSNAVYRNDAWDLVDRLKNDPKFDVKKIPDEELSEEMKKMKPEEREAFVKKKAAEREALQKQVQELSVKRDAFIAAERKKNPSQGDKAFDAAVRALLREQASGKGITIPE